MGRGRKHPPEAAPRSEYGGRLVLALDPETSRGLAAPATRAVPPAGSAQAGRRHRVSEHLQPGQTLPGIPGLGHRLESPGERGGQRRKGRFPVSAGGRRETRAALGGPEQIEAARRTRRWPREGAGGRSERGWGRGTGLAPREAWRCGGVARACSFLQDHQLFRVRSPASWPTRGHFPPEWTVKPKGCQTVWNLWGSYTVHSF